MKVKKNKRKTVSRYYKRSLSRSLSNYSLSQLLEIGSFKKRINDLSRNNRLLTTALQETRVEAAIQSNLLKDYARDTNQILFARIKLNEMAKNLARFATDLEEVKDCLNVSLPPKYDFFEKKGISNQRLSKAPNVSCIDEAPEFSYENSAAECDSSSDVSQSDFEGNIGLVNQDIEMTPTSPADDVDETQRKRSNHTYKGSVTPELDIDSAFVNQRRSTRSRGKNSSLDKESPTFGEITTHTNDASLPPMQQGLDIDLAFVNQRRSTKSKGKTSSIQKESPTFGEIDIHLNDASLPLMQPSQDMDIDLAFVNRRRSIRSREKSSSGEKGSSTSGEVVTHLNDSSPTLMPQSQDLDIDLAFVNQGRSTKSRGKTSLLEKESPTFEEIGTYVNGPSLPLMQQSQDPVEISNVEDNENLNVLSQNHTDKSINISDSDFSSIQSFVSVSNDKKTIASNDRPSEPNRTVLLFKDIELNYQVSPLQPLNNENNALFEANLEDNSEIHRMVQNGSENCVNYELFPEIILQTLSDNSLATSSLLPDNQLPEINEYDDEIQNVGSLTFCEPNEDDEQKNTVSPYVKTSRSKKPVKYTDYFSTDESDTDSPLKLAVEKRSGSRKIKVKSTSTGKSKTSTENTVETSDIIREIPETDYSVYNLDVSNSKKAGKKHKKKSSSGKSKNKKTNDLPKPLFQKCSVTKLKGGKFKFSKCEKPICKPSGKSLQTTCASPGGILKKNRSIISQTGEEGNIDDAEDIRQQSMLQTPSKRVSFASTDLVCSFARMSESKTIAENRKVRRASKSIADLTELFEDENPSKTSPTTADDSPERTVIPKLSNSVLFDFSADTEMYTITLPSNTHCSIPITDNSPSSKPSVFIASKPTKLIDNINDKHVEKSPETLTSSKNSQKLSLKGNKISDKTASQYISEIDVERLQLDSPKLVTKSPKRKSLFKESSDDALKENISTDDPSPEKISLRDIINTSSPLSTHNVAIKKSSNSKTKSNSKAHSKISLKKNKKILSERNSLEYSPVLTDATNLTASMGETLSRRRSKQVSYKEPSLLKKLRRD